MSDRDFVGSIPETYDRCLVPLLFRPFAEDLAARVGRAVRAWPSLTGGGSLAADGSPVLADGTDVLAGGSGVLVAGRRVLELAAGTGVLTAEVARAVPSGVRLVATDLQPDMLAVAARRVGAEFVAADAQALPFADGRADVVLCQFGVMFLPDKDRAYREMLRVLTGDGTLMVTVWDRIDRNPVAAAVESALAARFPDDPPRFLSRTPHGYHDPAAIRDMLLAAGFARVTVETVTLPGTSPSAYEVALGFCHGTPLRHEITARDPDGLPAATDAVRAAVADRFGDGPIHAPMTALLVTATGAATAR